MLVYSSAMLVRRVLRPSLSLFVAYAIVLGGVLNPALGHGFDPSMQLCVPGSGQTSGSPAQDGPKTQGLHECCLALCGAQPAMLPFAAAAERTVSYFSVVRTHIERRIVSADFRQARSARAPPAA